MARSRIYLKTPEQIALMREAGRVVAEILDLMRALQSKLGTSIILITHDMGVVAEMAARVSVMYAGRVVEEIRARDLHAAQHPYTRGLMACLPSIDGPQEPLPVLDRQAAWAED